MPLYIYNNGTTTGLLLKNSQLATAQSCCCGSGCTSDTNCGGNPANACEVCCANTCQIVTATFTYSPPSRSIREGSSISITPKLTCVPPNSTVRLTIEHIDTDATDFSGSLSLSRTVASNGYTSSCTFSTRNDSIGEYAESFLIALTYVNARGTTCKILSEPITIGKADFGTCCVVDGINSYAQSDDGTWDKPTCDAHGSAIRKTTKFYPEVYNERLCDWGICCGSNSSCTATIRGECGAGGTFYSSAAYPDYNCATNSPCVMGMCCVNGVDSGILTEGQCLSYSGATWFKNNFDARACDRGACCSSTGTCTPNTYRGACTGTNKYIGGSCTPNPCATCTSTTSNWSYQNPNTNLAGPPSRCYDPNYTYGEQTLSRGGTKDGFVYWPTGCNCVSISGTVDDILLINGNPVGYSGLCQGASSVNYGPVQMTANQFKIGVADTIGFVASYNLTIEFHNRCVSAFTAPPETTTETLQSAESSPPLPPTSLDAGPGTELKALLSKVGITSTPTCSCNARAMEMNRQGTQWCKDNEELILGWLKEEAEKRGLPFVKFGAKMLLRRAIKIAEKKAAAKSQADGTPPDSE